MTINILTANPMAQIWWLWLTLIGIAKFWRNRTDSKLKTSLNKKISLTFGNISKF